MRDTSQIVSDGIYIACGLEAMDALRFKRGAYRIAKRDISVKPKPSVKLPPIRVRQPFYSQAYKKQMNFPPGISCTSH